MTGAKLNQARRSRHVQAKLHLDSKANEQDSGDEQLRLRQSSERYLGFDSYSGVSVTEEPEHN